MDDHNYLQKAMNDFNEATARIMEAYAHLEGEFAKLNLELESKNQELETMLGRIEDVKSHLQSVLESLRTGVVVLDQEGKIRTVNSCAERFLGHTRESMLGQKVIPWLAEKGGGDWSSWEDLNCPRGDLGQRVNWNGRILDVFTSPLTSRTGETLGAVLVWLDVTRMVALEETTRRSEKLAAMGELAANIAHEIRNPLGSIELFASLLLKDLPESKNRERVSQIMGSVKKIDSKISNLLYFTEPVKPHLATIILADLIREIVSFADEIIADTGISLAVELDEKRDAVEGDAEMLKQVFFNLILNALQAMPRGGRLTVRSARALAAIRDQGSAVFQEVTVADRGEGIGAENIHRVFEPFFTTKEGSSGLGLAIAHNIVLLHRGYIRLKSKVGEGTEFIVGLPVAEKSDPGFREGRGNFGGGFNRREIL
jgi:PAS domain S-box-containing protein